MEVNIEVSVWDHPQSKSIFIPSLICHPIAQTRRIFFSNVHYGDCSSFVYVVRYYRQLQQWASQKQVHICGLRRQITMQYSIFCLETEREGKMVISLRLLKVMTKNSDV